MPTLLPTPRDAAQVLTTIHGCCVHLRSLGYRGLGEEIARQLTRDDARLNDLLAGRHGAPDFVRSAEAAYASTVHDLVWPASSSWWVSRAYSSGPAVSFAHAARAFVKAVAWEVDRDVPVRTVATYFDTFEHIPLVLLSDGPEKVAALLAEYSDTLAPFANASGVFQIFLTSTARMVDPSSPRKRAPDPSSEP